MNCYDFEANISAYIEGDLKQAERRIFTDHKENCSLCKEKLKDIALMIRTMSEFPAIKTSQEFINSLQSKIENHDQSRISIFKRLLDIEPFGMKPIHAFAFSLALIVMIISSYQIFDVDKIPNLNIEKITDRNQLGHPANENSINRSYPNYASVADTTSSDSVSLHRRNFNGKIQTVNKQK